MILPQGLSAERVARVLPACWALLLPLLLLGPALGVGYVLSYDMVWVPDLALRSDFLGFGTALPRAVPSDAVVAVLDEVVPGMLLQKVVLYGGLVLAALGYGRLVGRSTTARLVAVSLAVWNPFVAERLWIGHWPVLLGYAAVPWLFLAGRRARLEGRIPVAVWFLLPLGSLSASAGLVSALTLLVAAAGRPARGRSGLLGRLALGCVAVNAPWWAAGLLHSGDALAAGGFGVFGLRSEAQLPAPLAALGLGGIWNIDVVPTSRDGLLAWVALVLILGLAALGTKAWWRSHGDPRPVVLWTVGYLLAVLSWLTPDLMSWVGEHLPGGGLLRDGTRSLALCAPLLIGLVAVGADVLVDRIRRHGARAGIAVACVLFPIAVMTDAGWGLSGELRPTDFPDSWSGARTALGAPEADLLVLPFSSYRAPGWNDSRKVVDPLGRYLRPNYVVNDQLSIAGQTLAGEDPRVDDVRAALALGDDEARAAALGRLGIGFVARDLDAPGVGERGYDAQIAGRAVFDAADLQVVEISAPVDVRAISTATLVWMILAWAGLLGSLLVGVGGLLKHVRRRWLLARKQVLEFPAES